MQPMRAIKLSGHTAGRSFAALGGLRHRRIPQGIADAVHENLIWAISKICAVYASNQTAHVVENLDQISDGLKSTLTVSEKSTCFTTIADSYKSSVLCSQ